MTKMTRSYYAIIPANVRYDVKITHGAKLLYGEITALCNEKGYCWATNEYFANLYSVSKVTISKWVNQLVNNGYISSQMVYKEGTKEIESRYLRIVNDPIKENFNTPQRKVNDPIKEKFNTPIKEKFKENNTVFNNTSNNTLYILSNDEQAFLEILEKIKNYPLDREKDLEMYKTLGERYPELDLLEAIESWRLYKLDKPLTKKSNPRSQINNSFKKYVEWGRCLKKDRRGSDGTVGSDNGSKPITEGERLMQLAKEKGLLDNLQDEEVPF